MAARAFTRITPGALERLMRRFHGTSESGFLRRTVPSLAWISTDRNSPKKMRPAVDTVPRRAVCEPYGAGALIPESCQSVYNPGSASLRSCIAADSVGTAPAMTHFRRQQNTHQPKQAPCHLPRERIASRPPGIRLIPFRGNPG